MNAKLLALFVSLVAAGALVPGVFVTEADAATPLPLPTSGSIGGAVPNFKAVRVEYEDIQFNGDHLNTLCYIQNRSVTTPIVLKEMFVLGPGGVADIQGSYSGLVGTVVEPLGEHRFWVNDTVTGLQPQITGSAPGARTAVFVWEGDPDAMRLTAKIQRRDHYPNNDHPNVQFIVEGFDLIY